MDINGRILTKRSHKNGTFADLETQSSKIQIFFKPKIQLPKIGDIIEVNVCEEQNNSANKFFSVNDFKILNECLVPKFNKKLKDFIVLQNRLINIIRNNFKDINAIEVSTPILGKFRGTSKIEPFKTNDIYKRTYYLKFTHEMELKKIVAETQLAVFEIGKVFRNMGQSKTHFHEYTVVEAQMPYYKLDDGINIVKTIMKDIGKLFSSHDFFDIPTYTMHDIFLMNNYNFELMDENTRKYIYKNKIKKMDGPFFLKNPPKEWSPLTISYNNETAEDAELIYRGMGIAHICEEKINYNEILSGLTQNNKNENDLDKDFLDKMKIGLPPSTGLCIGVDRIFMIMQNKNSVREVVEK